MPLHTLGAGVSASARVRQVRRDDAVDVLAAFASAADMAHQGEVTTLPQAEQMVSWLMRDERHGFAIDVDGHLVGVVGVTVDELNRNGWVFYWMHGACRGQGLTSRAVATVANWALRPAPISDVDVPGGGLERLELGHRVNNPDSGAVARAAGFVVEGRERGKFFMDGERIDVLTYGRLRADRFPQTAPLHFEP